MNKKYSLHTSTKNKKEKRDIDKIYKKVSATKIYSSTIITFILLVFLVILSPVYLGKSYDYSTVKLSEPKNIVSTLSVVVDEMEINKNEGLFKIVLRYQDESGVRSLGNINSDYKLNYITNKGKRDVKQKVVKLSDESTVIYYSNLPKDFGVVSISINPSYVHDEIESTNDLKDKEIKFYAVDQDIKVNNKLSIESPDELRKNNFKMMIKTIENLIADEKDSIKKIKISTELVEKDIEKLELNLDFETTDEQVTTRNKISSLKNKIENNNNLIEESKNKIELYEEKIGKIKIVSVNF